MHVGKVVFRRQSSIQGMTQFVSRWAFGEAQLHRPRRGGCDCQQEIRAVITAKRQAFLAAQVGQNLPALTLDEVEEGARVALTTNYLKVALPGWETPPNRLIDVRIGRAVSGQLFGYADPARVASQQTHWNS